MIARKIVYHGELDQKAMEVMFDITRRNEITGEVKLLSPGKVELDLEGDPSMIKLIQHQIERRMKAQIKSKDVTPIPFRYYQGLALI
jgi:hypothetical protein